MRECIMCKECEYEVKDELHCFPKKEKSGNLPEANRNAVLADVLADIDKKDLTGGGGVLLVFKRDDLKEVLSKYFS